MAQKHKVEGVKVYPDADGSTYNDIFVGGETAVIVGERDDEHVLVRYIERPMVKEADYIGDFGKPVLRMVHETEWVHRSRLGGERYI